MGAHLAALRQVLHSTRDGLALDERAFCRRVFEHSRIPDEQHAAFLPLALWWAGGGESAPTALGGGWYACGTLRAHLRPWTGGERFLAVARCRCDDEGGLRFDLGAYLRAMLDACLIALEPARPVDELDSSATLCPAAGAHHAERRRSGRRCRGIGDDARGCPPDPATLPLTQVDTDAGLVNAGGRSRSSAGPARSNQRPNAYRVGVAFGTGAAPGCGLIRIEDD